MNFYMMNNYLFNFLISLLSADIEQCRLLQNPKLAWSIKQTVYIYKHLFLKAQLPVRLKHLAYTDTFQSDPTFHLHVGQNVERC